MLDHGLNLALAGALEPVLMVEREAFCVANLAWQMGQGFLPQVHIWDDVKTVARPRVREIVGARLGGRRLDFIFGGIPCQIYSQAGKRLGSMDERDLWPTTLRAVEVYQPRFVFIENVDGIASSEDGARRIICDLETAGYRTKAGLFSSKECGANHQRKRWFFLGIADNDGCQRENVSLSTGRQNQSGVESFGPSRELADSEFERLEGRASERKNDGAQCKTIERGRCELADGAFKSNYRERGERARRGREYSNSGYELADSECEQHQRRGESADVESPARTSESREDERQWDGRAAGDGSCDFPRYAPARNDFGAWAIVAELDPSRMPAIESSLRGVVDGLACWNHQLHACGNGVDSLVAAYAFVTLWAARQEES